MPYDEYPDVRGFHYLVAFAYSVVVAALWIPVFLVSRIRRFLREIGTEDWPRVEATITSGNVKVIHGWLLDYAVGQLDYSYKVHEEYYSGHLSRQFADEQAAWEFVDARRGKPTLVRYEEDHSEISVLREADQLAVANDQAGAGLGKQVWQHLRDELRGEPQDEIENVSALDAGGIELAKPAVPHNALDPTNDKPRLSR